MSIRTTLSLFSNLLQLRQSCHSIARQVINNMADIKVQIEFTKMKLELKRLLLSTIAILEEVQEQYPTTWDPLKEMMMTAAESGNLGERIQCLAMQSLASLAALGATSADVNNIQFAFLQWRN